MSYSESVPEKVLSAEQLDYWLAVQRFKNKKIVFTNGCFDILHLGHVDYLRKARDLGDLLFLGLNTDASVRRIKGSSRPVQDERSRAELLASMSFVDAVVLFDENTPYELIKKVQPDILVKGKDYRAEDVVGYDVVTSRGGKVVTIDLVEGYSTSSVIQRIMEAEKEA